MNALEIVSTEDAREGFFPTPAALADKLLAGIDWYMIQTVLEPSAGKGNLLDRVAEKWDIRRRGSYSSDRAIEVDCIEVDPYLRSILQYEYGGQKKDEIMSALFELREKQDRHGHALTDVEKMAKRELQMEAEKRKCVEMRIVHDDFLSFDSRKRYDLIIMNPPFANGDLHLLKAIEMQSRYGGEIRCLLNAETLRNPYTNRRMLLRSKLQDLGAEITYSDGEFLDGERKTDVSVAIIKIKIPAPHHESEIFDRLRKAAQIDETPIDDVTDLAVEDFMERIVSQFNVEIDAGLALIREYNAMQPYIMEVIGDEKYNSPILSLSITHAKGYAATENQFIRLVRRKYWTALFSNKEFVGRLTTNLRTKYRGMIDRLEGYDFTLFNIQQIVAQMNAEMQQGIQDTIVALFDKLTAQFAYYPEMQKNIHYYNGWKTNKAHKVNNKVILPVNGMFSDYLWTKTFDVRRAEEVISDIEKVFDYLDGDMTACVDLHGVLQAACEAGQTRNIQCKFFSVTLYKKGTMHIKFTNQQLLDRFNIYCCGKKNWLPPSYGRTKYTDMSTEEKAVVDGFNGDGTEGSGEKEYAKIQRESAYYLAAPESKMLAIAAPTA